MNSGKFTQTVLIGWLLWLPVTAIAEVDLPQVTEGSGHIVERADAVEIDLTEAERSFIKKHPVIKVANDATYPPMDFAVDGKPTGYGIELIDLLLRRVGLQAEFVTSDDWGFLVEAFKNKEIDALAAISFTEEDSGYTLYSRRYLTASNVLYIRRNDDSIHNAYDLEGKVVALPAEYEDLDELREHGISVKHRVVADMYEAMEAVAEGHADATVGSQVALKYMVDKEGYTSLKELQNIYGEEDYVIHGFYFGIRTDMPELQSLLNKAMDTVTIQEKRHLNEKWLGGSGDVKVRFTPEELAYLNKKGPLNMCVAPNWMPFEKINEKGKYIGIAAEILALAKARSDIEVHLVPTKSWHESLRKARDRECDFLPLTMKTEERSTYLNFTSPYLSLPLAVATRDDKAFVENLDSIRHLPLAIVKDFAYAEILRKKYPDINLIEVKNHRAGLRKVESGEVYGLIDTIAAIAYTIQREGLVGVKIAGRFDERWKLGFASRNDEPLLNGILQKTQASISDSEKKDIYHKWYSIRFEQGEDYSFLWKILAGTGLVLLVLFIWNRRLGAEKAKAQEARDKLQLVLESSGVGVWQLDLKNDTSFNDRRMWKILGYDRHDCEIPISELAQLIHPDDARTALGVLDEIIEGPEDKVSVEFRAVRQDGSICWIHDAGRVTERDGRGRAVKMVGIAMDVTSLKDAQSKAEEANRALKQETRFKEKLLRELYHRVKNNLQVISGFLSLQASHYQEPVLTTLLQESNLRIRAMARVHEQLYLADDPTCINMQGYLEDLIRENLRLHGDCKPKWSLQAEQLALPVGYASVIGLIINEILSNAFKHAFHTVNKPIIDFTFRRDNAHQQIELTVRDNGRPEKDNTQPPEEQITSLGLEIIEALVQQLNGTLQLQTEEGYHYRILFPEESLT